MATDDIRAGVDTMFWLFDRQKHGVETICCQLDLRIHLLQALTALQIAISHQVPTALADGLANACTATTLPVMVMLSHPDTETHRKVLHLNDEWHRHLGLQHKQLTVWLHSPSMQLITCNGYTHAETALLTFRSQFVSKAKGSQISTPSVVTLATWNLLMLFLSR